jgi:type IV secretion system protein VirB10
VTPTGNKVAAGGLPQQNPTASRMATPHRSRRDRQMDGDVLVVGGESSSGLGDDGGHRHGSSTPAAAGAGNARAPVPEVVRGGLDDKVKPSALLAGKAGQRPDLSLLLRRNTAIPCGTVTYIVSEHPGSVMCVVANDVYSADGSVVLIERGSVAHGERREVMLQGQARIGAIWSRIDTPYGVFADVNSLATDALGATGIPAQIDNHLSERFGGAVLLSLIGDFGQAVANRANNSGGTIQFSNTSTAGQDLASKTLEHTINIPPTGYVNQGAATTILVLRDMDFRGVYELARK